jgi:hypothetical protein
MTRDGVTNDASEAPPLPAGPQDPPVKVLLISPTLERDVKVPAPVEFANALATQGAAVLFAAAVGQLRLGLSRAVGYFMIDDANHAPVKTAHELSRLVRVHRPDVVHSHGTRCAMVAALAVKASHAKCARVMTHHSPASRRVPGWIKGPILKRCADRYFAVNDARRSELERLGIPAELILVEPAGAALVSEVARDSIEVYRRLMATRDGNP